jgi:hypothetical protein
MQVDLRTLFEHLWPAAFVTAAVLAVGVLWWWRHLHSRR